MINPNLDSDWCGRAFDIASIARISGSESGSAAPAKFSSWLSEPPMFDPFWAVQWEVNNESR